MSRIWLDVTGIRPGTDGAVFALHLDAALRALHPAGVIMCRREPGLVSLDWPCLDATDRPYRQATPTTEARARRLAQALPDRGRAAIGRFVRLQKAAWSAWRRAAQLRWRTLRQSAAVDRVHPDPGDVLMMLSPAGDAARFAERGTRLVLVAAVADPLSRPDQASQDDAAAAAIWRRLTAPHVFHLIACSDMDAQAIAAVSLPTPIVVTAADCLAPSRPATEATNGRLVLAAGEIGAAGQTRHLLLAWRALLDDPGDADIPTLVIAGPIGPLAGDVLAQLHNSQDMAGRVRLVAQPTPSQLRALLDTCLFCIAPAGSGWGRATWDSLAAGVPCLSAHAVAGSEPIDPSDAATLARQVKAWLLAPPPRPAPPSRDWQNVARDLLAAIGT